MTSMFVDISRKGRLLEVSINDTNPPLTRVEFYLDERYIGALPGRAQTFHFPLSLPPNQKSKVLCKGILQDETTLTREFIVQGDHIEPGDRTFLPGDVLVACDNVGSLPPGLMGHSAIVYDEKTIIEAVSTKPYIRKYSVASFLEEHPLHAQYRPKDPKVGLTAKNAAVKYLNYYRRNRKRGIERPTFSFSESIPLDDLRKSTYCSKLVWLAYAYGPKIKLENDHFLFSPEDLEVTLEKHPEFIRVYKHPYFDFTIDS